jgi:hypothetical protein
MPCNPSCSGRESRRIKVQGQLWFKKKSENPILINKHGMVVAFVVPALWKVLVGGSLFLGSSWALSEK